MSNLCGNGQACSPVRAPDHIMSPAVVVQCQAPEATWIPRLGMHQHEDKWVVPHWSCEVTARVQGPHERSRNSSPVTLLHKVLIGALTSASFACSDFSQFSDILYSLLGWGELFQTSWCGSGGGARYTILAPTNKVRCTCSSLSSMRRHSNALCGGPC